MKKSDKKYKQRGRSKKKYDLRHKAKKPGWRRSKSGKWYFENRRNRSDTDRRKKL